MAVTAAPYATFLLGLAQAKYNLATDTIKVVLASSTYTPSMSGHTMLSNVTGLVTAASAQTLTGITFTYLASTFTVTVAAADVVWTAASWTARYAVIYKDTGTASTSPLIGYIDFGSDRVYDSEDFTLTFSSGVVQIPAAT